MSTSCSGELKRTRNAAAATQVLLPSQKRVRGADPADHVEVIELGQQNSESEEQKSIQTNAEHTRCSHTPSIQNGTSSHFVDFETRISESNLIPTQKAGSKSTVYGYVMSLNDPTVANFHFEEDSL